MNGDSNGGDNLSSTTNNGSSGYLRSSSNLSTFSSSSPRFRRYEESKKSYLSSGLGSGSSTLSSSFSSKYTSSASSTSGPSYRLASLDRLAYRQKLYDNNGSSELTPVTPPTVPTSATSNSTSATSNLSTSGSLSSPSGASNSSATSSTSSLSSSSFLHSNNVSLAGVNGGTNGVNGAAHLLTAEHSSLPTISTVDGPAKTNGLVSNGVNGNHTTNGYSSKPKEVTNHITTATITTLQQPVSCVCLLQPLISSQYKTFCCFVSIYSK